MVQAAESASARARNHILLALSAADYALLESDLEFLDLPLRHEIEEPNVPIKHVYFPEDGLASVVAVSGGDKQIEVGLIGREGMTGTSVAMGSDRSPHATFIQVAGRGARIEANDLRRAMKHSASLQLLFLNFAQAFMIQTAHTALANGRATIQERLARWLLMAHDRLPGDTLSLTHEFLALMLGVRRAGVTAALHGLEAKSLIRIERGAIVIVRHNELVKAANGIYGRSEIEYRRLIGWKPVHKS
jgi:CRP-like cAMP-binding protein